MLLYCFIRGVSTYFVEPDTQAADQMVIECNKNMGKSACIKALTTGC
jgi:hypothetical protein